MADPTFYRLDSGKQVKVEITDLKKGDFFQVSGAGQPGVTFYVQEDPIVEVTEITNNKTGETHEKKELQLKAIPKDMAIEKGILGEA